jgi:hypothetical protein
VWWISTTIFAWWIGNDFDVGTLSNLCGGISTTIFAWWTGNDFDNNVGTLSNLCGGYLPPYLHGGLAMIYDVGTLSNLCGGYLPPYLHGGLAMILMWEPYPICVSNLVDIYHHICMVDWQ